MLKGILWDNDGVLAHTENLFYHVNRDLLAGHSLYLSVELYVEWFLESNIGAWHVLASRGYNETELSNLRAERNRRYTVALQGSHNLARGELLPLLIKLSGRARMAIVTASFDSDLRLIHRSPLFFNNFEYIVTREQAKRSKPAPDCYLAAMAKMKLEPASCIAVEDSPRGLAAAVAAGVKCVVIRNELLSNYHFVGAAEVVDDVQELAKVLEDFLA